MYVRTAADQFQNITNESYASTDQQPGLLIGGGGTTKLLVAAMFFSEWGV